MMVPEILHGSARRRPDALAAWHQGRWTPYGELSRQALGIAAALQSHGVQPGERVALLLENSPEYIAAHFGVLTSGAVEVSLNTDLKGEDLLTLIQDCDAQVLIAGKKFLRNWGSILSNLPELKLVVSDVERTRLPAFPNRLRFLPLSDALQFHADAYRTVTMDENALASIVYTSGSTGRPKGVMLTHRNLASNTRSIADYLTLSEEDRMLVVLPFYYIYGRSLLYTHFVSGGSIVIDNRFAFPVAVLNTMEEQEVTCFAGVPSTYSILMRKTDAAKRRFPKLRLLTQAGGAMAPALQKEVARSFHPAQLCIMYGSTEAAPRLTYLEPRLLPEKWGSIGRAIPGVEVTVVDEKGDPVPRGTTGEIAAKGPNIMPGYWKDPEGTQGVFRNGYYLTGDLGYEDEDGCLFITGRARDIVKVGGNRVSAKEVEEIILELPEVVEAAVIGVPDEILGEAMKAFVVVLDSTHAVEAIHNHLKQRLPSYKLPTQYELVEALPKNQSGKVLKEELRGNSLTKSGAVFQTE